MTLNLHHSDPSDVKGGAIMQNRHLNAKVDTSIRLAETHPQRLLERIIKLEERIVLLESSQANINERKP